MCGIGGIYRIGSRPIRKWQLKHMAVELEHRGLDATGFALMDTKGDIEAWKIALPAWKAVCLAEFDAWADKALTKDTQIALVHTRAYTKGSPNNNENNHPLYKTPVEGVVVHNGMVRNDDALFEANKTLPNFERSCVTDSDIFRALLDEHGGVDKALIKQMNLVDGTAAVAAFHRNTPGKLLLLRDSNPLVLGATSDTLAFASTKEAIFKVLKPFVKVHNLTMQVHAPDLSFIAMPDETGYIIGPEGLESHDVFKCNGRATGGYVKYGKNVGYYDKQDRARLAAKTEKRYGPVGARSSEALSPAFSPALFVPPAVKTPLLPIPNPTAKAKARPALVELKGQEDMNNPSLFEYTICGNAKCNRHVELSADDRRLSSLALLACASCGANLAGGPDAGLVN